jgi:hypothetical protein
LSATVVSLGGEVVQGADYSPFGRLAQFADPIGFRVIGECGSCRSRVQLSDRNR